MARIFDTPIITNDQSIERVLAAGLPVVLVFLNDTGSTPLDQAEQRLARENAGQLLVAQVPARDNPASVRRYQVGQLPAVVTVREGKVLTKAETISATELEKHTAFLLGKGPRPEKERPASTHAQAQPGPAAGASEDRPHAATDASFDQDVLHARLPVLVDFWAPGCGPCRAMEPILEKLARELSGRLRVVKVNASQNPYTAQRYGVQGVPTMLVVKDGRVVNRLVGALPEATLRQRLMPWLS